ncbi:MAG: DNA polymerase III subunit chi [Pseudomonadota bacterium]
MSRVDFYVLSDTSADARESFACRLAAKASQLDNRVHILHGDPDHLETMDALLWTFSDASFVAHDRWPADDAIAPVTLGIASDGLPEDATVCINLTSTPVMGCQRVAEIVAANDDAKTASRQLYAAYRDDGAELNTHKI